MECTWNSCVGISTDEVPCMIGSIKDFVSLVQRESPNVVETHCFLHREVLVSQTILDELNQVLKQVIEIINFIKTKPLQSRLLEKICVDMDSQQKRLILHTEPRWLSRGKVLCHAYELHKKLHVFFKTEKHKHVCEYLQCEFWLSRLEYLAEIFAHLNSLNPSMQGRETTSLLHWISCLHLKRKLQFGKTELKMIS